MFVGNKRILEHHYLLIGFNFVFVLAAPLLLLLADHIMTCTIAANIIFVLITRVLLNCLVLLFGPGLVVVLPSLISSSTTSVLTISVLTTHVVIVV